jgi:hypothetical protein
MAACFLMLNPQNNQLPADLRFRPNKAPILAHSNTKETGRVNGQSIPHQMAGIKMIIYLPQEEQQQTEKRMLIDFDDMICLGRQKLDAVGITREDSGEFLRC